MPRSRQPQPTAAEVEDDPFKYGWRYVKHTRPDGTIELDQIPLTLEDVLHPEEDDFIVHSDLHDTECSYLKQILRTRVQKPPLVKVTSDLRIDWGVKGLRAHGPDVAVFVGMHTLPRDTAGTLYLARTGGYCTFVAEIVSPSTRSNDVGPKFEHYHRANVPLYVLVDQQEEDGPRSLQGYQRTSTGYAAIPLDSTGRLLLEPFGLWLKLRDNRLVCQDVASGRDYAALDQQIIDLEQADQKLHEQAQVMEESILARQTAERHAYQEEQARQTAEVAKQKAEEEKRAAQRKARAEAKARKAAEAQALQEAESRLQLEERVRQLEALLRAPDRPTA